MDDDTLVGSLAQRARIASYLSTDGPDAGTRVVRVRTDSGLDIDLLPDRGLDIGAAAFRGVPLAWLSGAGFPAMPPTMRDKDWVAAFGGGLLTTCGVDTFGQASEAAGRHYPMHGARTGLKMEVVEKRVLRHRAQVSATGLLTSLFDDVWELRRTITVGRRRARIRVRDRVTNRAHRDGALMVLYHVNLGSPVIDDAVARIESGASEVVQVGGAPAAADRWRRMGPPDPDAGELVFRHRGPGERGLSVAGGPVAVRVTASDTLPFGFQWIYPRAGRYALGLEPASSGTLAGRVAAEAAGDVLTLAPGASQDFQVVIDVSENASGSSSSSS